jgi:hypothetical protein
MKSGRDPDRQTETEIDQGQRPKGVDYLRC